MSGRVPLSTVRLTLRAHQPLDGEADAYISLRRFGDAIGDRLRLALSLQFLRSDGAKAPDLTSKHRKRQNPTILG